MDKDCLGVLSLAVVVVIGVVIGEILLWWFFPGVFWMVFWVLIIVGLFWAIVGIWRERRKDSGQRYRASQEQWAWLQKRAESRYLEERQACVYFIENAAGHVKIGRSTDPDRRLKSLQTGNSDPLTLVHVGWFHSEEEARHCEEELHYRLDAWRVRGEWFQSDGLDYARLLNETAHAVSVKRSW